MSIIRMRSARDKQWLAKAEQEEFDFMFKALIIGSSGVGKTAVLMRYADDRFSDRFNATVGIDFKTKIVTQDDHKVKMQIWDTAGQERYRTITTSYYRGSRGFLLMYDITNQDSFTDVRDWINQIKDHGDKDAVIVLVGNKSDLEENRVVNFQQGQQLADSLGVQFLETSAKDAFNIKQVFDLLVSMVRERMPKDEEEDEDSVDLTDKDNSSSCCNLFR